MAQQSTIIISVYKDVEALRAILENLKTQTCSSFDVIISEDGESSEMKSFIENCSYPFHLVHLTQRDDGFRKNIALNRAILAADTEHLIFIDGDCVPHPEFICAHQQHAGAGLAATGRRLELGEKISQKIRKRPALARRLASRLFYLLLSPYLQFDRAKNLESGIYSKLLHRYTEDRDIRLLGCNFSCQKTDLININGFNEDYRSPGIGEDSDIDWRLVMSGIRIKNVKFSAIQYHLHHERRYTVSPENKALLEKTHNAPGASCENGISNHL